MFHMELFSSSIATGANAFAQLTYFTPDNVIPKLVNGMQVPANLNRLMFVAGVGTNLVHVRAQAPSMLPFPYPALSPNNRGSAFESPPRVWDYSTNPIVLNPTEELDIFATQNAAGAQTEYVAVMVSDGMRVAPPPGRFFTVHWTASTTLTAGAWTQVQPSFDQALPAGTYSLIGARTFSATALFFRMFPAQAPLLRPGGIAVQAYDQLDAHGQRGYDYLGTPTSPWGEWMHFFQNVPPQVEIFATSADTAEEGWFDLVQINQATTGGML